MPSSPTLRPFSEVSARAALLKAADALGLAADDEPRLLGPVADNAVFRVAPGIVGRVASSSTVLRRVELDLAVAKWLAEQRFPAVRVLDGLSQPVVVEGRVASFWHEVVGAVMASPGELGALLSGLHRLATPDQPELPRLEPFVRVPDHLAAAADNLPAADIDFLANRQKELETSYDSLQFALPSGPIHGDPNRKNAVRGTDGRAVLLDLERFSIGPREWDLVVPAVYHRLGWYDDAEYAEFTEAYGMDVREWSGFEVLASIRELRMTAWLAARVPREPRLMPEARLRIESLRRPDLPRAWTPGA